MTATENLPSVIGLAEIADLYEVSKTTVGNWTRRSDWPRPIANLKMGPVWDTAEVVAHKTPASQQQFQIRCAHCYSGAVYSIGINGARCGSCGLLSTITIEEIPGGDASGWSTVMISVTKKEDL